MQENGLYLSKNKTKRLQKHDTTGYHEGNINDELSQDCKH